VLPTQAASSRCTSLHAGPRGRLSSR
jgi:hypothetical protein